MAIHFLTITINEKGIGEDYRAFLTFAERDTMTVFEIRGYGDTPGEAADDAYHRFETDREKYIEDSWEWV